MEKEYTVIGSSFKGAMVFKYCLNGYLTSFELKDSDPLTEKQQNWMFRLGKFPYKEQELQAWKAIVNFTITEGELDLSFEVFWNAYGHKVKRQMAMKSWTKLSDDDKIAALAGIKHYLGYLKRKKNIEKAHPSTYLNQRYWEDEWGSAA